MDLRAMRENIIVQKISKFLESNLFIYCLFALGFLNWLLGTYIWFSLILILVILHTVLMDLNKDIIISVIIISIVGYLFPKTLLEQALYYGSISMIYILLIIDMIKKRNLVYKNSVVYAYLGILIATMLSSIGAWNVAVDSIKYVWFDAFRIVIWLIPSIYLLSNLKNIEKSRMYLSRVFLTVLFLITLQFVVKVLEYPSPLEALLNGKSIGLGWATVSTLSSMLFLFVYPFIIYLYYKTNKIYYLIISLICLAIPVILRSRGGMFGMIPMVTLTVVFLIIKSSNKKKTIVDLLLAYVVPGVLAFILPTTRSILFGILEKLKEVGLHHNSRLELYELAIANFIKSPLFGTGSYTSVYHIQIKFGNGLHHYHNIFLQALSCTGSIGFAAFLYYLFILIKRGVDKNFFNLMFLVLLVYLIFHGQVDTTFYNYIIMMFIAIVIPLIAVNEGKETVKAEI